MMVGTSSPAVSASWSTSSAPASADPDWILYTFRISDDQFASYFEAAQASSWPALSWAHGSPRRRHRDPRARRPLHLPVLLYFFLYDGERIWAWIVRLFPRTHATGWTPPARSPGASSRRLPRPPSSSRPPTRSASRIGAPSCGSRSSWPSACSSSSVSFVPVIGARSRGTVAVLLALVAHGPGHRPDHAGRGHRRAAAGVARRCSRSSSAGRSRVHPLSVILAIAIGVIIARHRSARSIAVPFAAVANAVGHHLLDEPSESIPDPDEDTGAIGPDPVPPREETEDGGERPRTGPRRSSTTCPEPVCRVLACASRTARGEAAARTHRAAHRARRLSQASVSRCGAAARRGGCRRPRRPRSGSG